MLFKSIITAKVVSETLTKVISLLSSASLNLTAEQIKGLVEAKIGKTNATFAGNNDIGFCVTRLLEQCGYGKISSVEELEQKYPSIREEDEIITQTIDMMAEGIAKHISPVLYELREVIPEETRALVEEINEQLPVIEALQAKDQSLKIFNWGKLQDSNCLTTTIMFAKDKASCFKDGVVRQHDSANILRRVPFGTFEKLHTDANFTSTVVTLLQEDLEALVTDKNIRAQLTPYLHMTATVISNDRIHMHTIMSLKESLTENNLSENIVSVVEKIDAIEDILRMVTVQTLNKNENTKALAAKLFTNIETVLDNIKLIRASLIFHKVHTLQGKLILSKTTIQESALPAFHEANGTEQMIKDHLTYMELNDLVKIPTNGLSVDVVLNTSAKAKAVVQKNAAILKSREESRRVKALQGALTYGLEVHYKNNIEAGIYQPTLEVIHERQVAQSVAVLLKKSVDDIALEYLVTLRNNKIMSSFFKAMNAELHSLVKNQTDVSQEMVQSAVCSSVVSVLYDSLVEKFSTRKEAA